MFVDWFKHVSTNFVYVYEIYASYVKKRSSVVERVFDISIKK